MNPIRAGMVNHPGEYHWSSYQTNGKGDESTLLTPHILYQRLGRTAVKRQEAYRDLFHCAIKSAEMDKIRQATNGNFALGNDKFQQAISAVLGCRVTPGKAGRPRKREH